MSRSYRERYNNYMRRRYLRRRLEQGAVPQPLKPASWLLSLYKEFGVESQVYIPQAWMNAKTLKAVRQKRKDIRARVRNILPANASRSDIELAMQEVAKRVVYKKFIEA